MDIFPEKVVRTRGTSDGGFISTIFSLEAWVNLGLLGFFIALFFFIAALPIITCILLLAYCIDIDKSEKQYGLNIFGMLIPIYLLIDIHKGWIVSMLLSFIFNGQEMERIIHISHAGILCNFLVLLFSESIFKLSGENNFISLIIISVMVFLSYHLSVFIF